MKNATNTSSALKIVRPVSLKKKATVKPSVMSADDSDRIDEAASVVMLDSEAFLETRKRLRKSASVLRTAAYLLQFAGLIGEVIFLAGSNFVHSFLVNTLNASNLIASFASISVGLAGVVYGIICVCFGICLAGTAETISSDTKKLTPAK